MTFCTLISIYIYIYITAKQYNWSSPLLFKFFYLMSFSSYYLCCFFIINIRTTSGIADHRLEHSCLCESVPNSSFLRTIPGQEDASVAWLQVSLNSLGPGLCRLSLFQSQGGMLMVTWRDKWWSSSGSSHATCSYRHSLLNRIVTDGSGQPVRCCTSALVALWL